MAIRRPVVIADDGRTVELPSGDALPSGLSYEEATLNTGTANVFNPARTSSNWTISGNGLTSTVDTIGNASGFATIGRTTGKWYFEAVFANVPNADNQHGIGVGSSAHALDRLIGASTAADHGAGFLGNGTTNGNGNNTTLGSPPTVASGDVVAVAYDANTREIWFAKDNVWINDTAGNPGDPAAGTNPRYTIGGTAEMFPGVSVGDGVGDTATFRFNATDTTYAPPTGFDYWTDESDPSYQITNADQDKLLHTNTSGSVKVFLPNDVEEALGVGFAFGFHMKGTGSLNYQKSDFLTTGILSATGLYTQSTQHSIAYAIKTAADTWTLYGNIDGNATTGDAAAAVTFENLNANGDVGTGSTQVAQGDHPHDLDFLSDVDLTTTAPITDDVLAYNGTLWVPTAIAAGGGGGPYSAPASGATLAANSQNVADTSTAAVSYNLPAGSAGRWVEVLDGQANAATNNITLTPQTGEALEGTTDDTYVIGVNSAAVRLVYVDATRGWVVGGGYAGTA